MAHFEAWIIDCQLAHIDREDEYQCQAAIWAENHDGAMHLLAEHLDPQGYRILWVDECLPARLYHNVDGANIIAGAHEGRRVVLGPIVSAATPETSGGYLSIEELEDVTPLDAQFGAWPLKTVPDALREPLFDQPDPTAAEIAQYGDVDNVPAMKTYAILDAAKVFGLIEILETAELEYRCLFKGDAAEEYRDVAPYLIELKDDDPFTRLLVTHLPDQPENMTTMHLWHREAGIFVRSRASFDDIWGHFRKFTKLQNENKKWYYFRFWEPETCRYYLEGVSHRRERIAYIMQTARAEMLRIVIYDSSQNACVLTPVSVGQRPSGQMILDQTDMDVLGNIAFRSFSAELARWLMVAYQDRLKGYNKQQLRALSDHVVQQGQQYGLSTKEDHVYLAHIMTTLGGWFALTGQPQELLDILQDRNTQKHARLQEAFLPAYQTTPMAQLTKNWAEVQEFIRSIPEDEQMIPKRFKEFTSRFLANQRPALASLLRVPSDYRDNQRLPKHLKGRYMILELCLGHRFESDPFRPWAHLPANEVIEKVWGSAFVNTYSEFKES